MTVFIGIDCGKGKAGAVSIVKGKKIIFSENFPTVVIPKGTKTTVIRDRGAFVEMCREFPRDSVVTVETPFANGNNGAIANFEMGAALDMVFMTLMFLKMPYEKVAPIAWKQKLKLRGGIENKDESIVKCQELFPDSWQLTRPKHSTQNKLCKADHNRCEAALIAVYGQRYLYNKKGVLTFESPQLTIKGVC
jgi:hypothetical protein